MDGCHGPATPHRPLPISPQAPPRCLIRLGASGSIEVQLPFDAVTQAQLRAVRPRGQWLARRACWQFPLEAAVVLRRQFAGRTLGHVYVYRDSWPAQAAAPVAPVAPPAPSAGR